MQPEIKKPIWYLAGPFYQYNEDVKKLAMAAGLRIIDANVTLDRTDAADPDRLPEVTLVADGLPAPKEAAAPAPAKPKADTVADGTVDLGNGQSISAADLEAKAVELSGLTPGKFKQQPKAARESFVLVALEQAKAAAVPAA